MPIVLTLDQRGSRGANDMVPEFVAQMNDRFSPGLERSFVRVAGDEIQAVLGESRRLAPIVLEALEDGHWWIGVGVGSIDALGETSRDSRGAAFWHARDAVESARKTTQPQPVFVAGPDDMSDVTGLLNALLTSLAFIVRNRSKDQAHVAKMVRAGRNGAEIADDLAVSRSNVSRMLRRAGTSEEALLVDAVGRVAASLSL